MIDPANIDSHLANDVVKEPQTVDESVSLLDHVSIDSHLAHDVDNSLSFSFALCNCRLES